MIIEYQIYLSIFDTDYEVLFMIEVVNFKTDQMDHEYYCPHH